MLYKIFFIILAAAFFACASDKDPWFGMDKAKHAGAAMVITGITQYKLHHQLEMSSALSRTAAISFTFSLGVLKEMHDQRQPNNFFSCRDIIANSLGIALGVLLFN